MEGCSEACAALQAVGIRQNKIAPWNHWDYFIILHHIIPLFSTIRKQASLFLNVAAGAEQKIVIQTRTTK